jgi:hypothetical protein
MWISLYITDNNKSPTHNSRQSICQRVLSFHVTSVLLLLVSVEMIYYCSVWFIIDVFHYNFIVHGHFAQVNICYMDACFRSETKRQTHNFLLKTLSVTSRDPRHANTAPRPISWSIFRLSSILTLLGIKSPDPNHLFIPVYVIASHMSFARCSWSTSGPRRLNISVPSPCPDNAMSNHYFTMECTFLHKKGLRS